MIARVLAIAVAIAFARPAAADGRSAEALVTEARAAFDGLRYEDSLRLVERAWHRGQSGPAELRAVFSLAGQAAASMGDEDGARLWFSRWSSLEPTAELPPGTSPKLTALLADAKAALGGAALEARAERSGDEVEVTVVKDPLALADAVRSGTTRVRLEAGRATVPADGDIELLDRDGNVLSEVSPERPGTRTVVAPAAEPRWFERPSVWAITAGGLGAIGGVALVVALNARSSIDDLNADSPNHEFTEARSLERRFTGAQWVSRFAFGGAVVAAGAGLVFYVRGRGEQRAAIVPASSGAAVSWSTRF